MRLSPIVLAGVCGLGGVAHGAAVPDALDRPALTVRAPARAVLLGAAQCGDRVVAVGERGLVATSTNQGKTWQQARVPTAVTLTAVRCPAAHTAYATGHGGVVLASADGGLTWQRRLDGRTAAKLALEAARAGGDAKAVQDAERLAADGPDKPFLDLHFFDERHGIVVGAYGLAFATEDAGQTWRPLMQRLPNPGAAHLYALRVRGQTVVIAGEQGLVLRSTDSGRTFASIATPYKGSFFTAELPGEQEIVLAGLKGNVWRSGDGGRTWNQVANAAPSSITASAVAGRHVLLGNQAGQVLRLADGRLAPLAGAPLPPLTALHPAGSGAVLAFSYQGAAPLRQPDSQP